MPRVQRTAKRTVSPFRFVQFFYFSSASSWFHARPISIRHPRTSEKRARPCDMTHGLSRESRAVHVSAATRQHARATRTQRRWVTHVQGRLAWDVRARLRCRLGGHAITHSRRDAAPPGGRPPHVTRTACPAHAPLNPLDTERAPSIRGARGVPGRLQLARPLLARVR